MSWIKIRGVTTTEKSPRVPKQGVKIVTYCKNKGSRAHTFLKIEVQISIFSKDIGTKEHISLKIEGNFFFVMGLKS